MWINKTREVGFGLAPIRREGWPETPDDYLGRRGEWPKREAYTDEQYAKIQTDGWEWVED